MAKIPKVALITGAARRVGAAITRYLHAQGMNVVIHHHSSEIAAQKLAADLNSLRQNSAVILKAKLNDNKDLSLMAQNAAASWHRLDVLVNNAARFYATPFHTLTIPAYQELLTTNLQAPLFLSQACATYLKQQQGCIVNITDIHAEIPLKQHIAYCMSKAGLTMMTKSLAKELAPDIRVNAIAPGAVCWPENENQLNEDRKTQIINQTVLKRKGTPEDIAKAVWFLVNDAPYVTGQILKIDGGRYL